MVRARPVHLSAMAAEPLGVQAGSFAAFSVRDTGKGMSPETLAHAQEPLFTTRAGGTGLISGRKAFQRPMTEGVDLLNAIQDVYLSDDVTIA